MSVSKYSSIPWIVTKLDDTPHAEDWEVAMIWAGSSVIERDVREENYARSKENGQRLVD